MIEHLAAMLVSATAFFGAILLYGAFSPRPIGWLEVLDLLCRVLRSDGGGWAAGKWALFRLRGHRQ